MNEGGVLTWRVWRWQEEALKGKDRDGVGLIRLQSHWPRSKNTMRPNKNLIKTLRQPCPKSELHFH